MLTAEQKIRQTLTGNPFGEPHFEHQGEHVIRWLTGGSLADAWVTFHHQGDQIVLRCATCQVALGCIPADGERAETAPQLRAVRLSGHACAKPVIAAR
jgi:hypothetical protein